MCVPDDNRRAAACLMFSTSFIIYLSNVLVVLNFYILVRRVTVFHFILIIYFSFTGMCRECFVCAVWLTLMSK